MLLLTRSDVKAAVTMVDAVEVAAKAMASYSSGVATIPVRTPVETRHGVGLFMPGALPDCRAFGVKVVSVFPQNPDCGLPTITALLVLNDIETGLPIAAMEAGYLTALRTGAAAGVATKYLAREDSRSVLVIGAGAQARTQLEAVCAVRQVEQVWVCDVNPAAASAFAVEMSPALGVDVVIVPDANAFASSADIIICATTSKTPVFDGELVRPGTHINAVGSYKPDMRELDEVIVARAHRVVCDSAEAAWKEAGDLLVPLAMDLIDQTRIDAEVGHLVLGSASGRRSADEITIYKAVGLAALDLATAQLVYERALQSNAGTKVDLQT